MGYRSEVAIGIRLNNSKVNWETFVTECKARHPLAFNNEALCFDIFNERKTMAFTQYELKWYPDFEDVQAFMGVINVAKEYNDQHELDVFDIAYVRVGEESDDVEVDYTGNGHEMFEPYTNIGGDLYDELYGGK